MNSLWVRSETHENLESAAGVSAAGVSAHSLHMSSIKYKLQITNYGFIMYTNYGFIICTNYGFIITRNTKLYIHKSGCNYKEVVAMPPPGGCARGGGQWAGTHGPPGRSRHAVLKKITERSRP